MPKNTSDKNESTVEKVKGKAKSVVSDLSQATSDAVESTKEQVAEKLEETKESVLSQVHDLDQVLRETAEKVSNPGLGAQITKLADSVDRVATGLESTELDDVITAIERFARSSPTVFLAGSFAVGLAASRFLRASAHRFDDEDDYTMMSSSRSVGTRSTWSDQSSMGSTSGLGATSGMGSSSGMSGGTSGMGGGTSGTRPYTP